MKPKITVVQGSLTDSNCLVLVNAANTNLDLGSGVSGAIRRACGKGYQEYLHWKLIAENGDYLDPGAVIVTGAGDHPSAKWIAHVAVMDYRPDTNRISDAFPDARRLIAGYENLWKALETIETDQPLTVAMVALGAGTGGWTVADSTWLARSTLAEHLCHMEEVPPGSKLGELRFFGYTPEEANDMRTVLFS